MARANTQKDESPVTLDSPTAKPQGTALTVLDMEADAGAGMEGANSESFAIPFLQVLQKNSPQVDETSGAVIEGAKQGMFYENVTGKLMDGKKGVLLVPCAYRRVYLRWAPRDAGGGFKGEIAPETVAKMRDNGEVQELDGHLFAPLADGSVNPKKCDKFADTRLHYCLLIDPDTGYPSQVLLSLTSTQVKKSKALMSMLAGKKLPGANGLFTPPTYALRVRATTIPESNDKGSWMGIKFELDEALNEAVIYEAGKSFNKTVAKGIVTANYDGVAGEDGVPAADGRF
jgi:hypothetical protein